MFTNVNDDLQREELISASGLGPFEESSGSRTGNGYWSESGDDIERGSGEDAINANDGNGKY